MEVILNLIHTHKKNKFQVDFRYECEKQIATKVLKDTLREYLHDLGVRKNILKGRKCTNHKGKDWQNGVH